MVISVQPLVLTTLLILIECMQACLQQMNQNLLGHYVTAGRN